MAENKNFLVFAELQDGIVRDGSLELLSEAGRIAIKAGGDVSAVLVGNNDAAQINRLASLGARKVFVYDDPSCASYAPELYTQVLANLIQEQQPGMVLIGATASGKDLAPRLAARLKAPLVSECTSLSMNEQGEIIFNKVVHAGRLSANVAAKTTPQIITVKPGMMDIGKANPSLKAEVVKISPPDNVKQRVRITGFVRGDSKTISLSEADVIVAGGAGLGSQENMKLLEALAELVGGTVGVSRVPVDNGWAPLEKQVGQTGKTVQPSLYFACGISGAIYHTMGMKDSKVIIAINKDKNAPIFKLADIGVVGDLKEVLPAVIARIREEATGAKKV